MVITKKTQVNPNSCEITICSVNVEPLYTGCEQSQTTQECQNFVPCEQSQTTFEQCWNFVACEQSHTTLEQCWNFVACE